MLCWLSPSVLWGMMDKYWPRVLTTSILFSDLIFNTKIPWLNPFFVLFCFKTPLCHVSVFIHTLYIQEIFNMAIPWLNTFLLIFCSHHHNSLVRTGRWKNIAGQYYYLPAYFSQRFKNTLVVSGFCFTPWLNSFKVNW